MYFVYIIYSQKRDKFYIGQSDSIEKRLQSHNSGLSNFTSRASDWVIVYQEEYLSRQEARKRENAIKRKKSRQYILSLIGNLNSH